MRYKEQSINKIEQIENTIKLINAQINRNETRQTVQETIKILETKVDELRSLIQIEPGDFFTSK